MLCTVVEVFLAVEVDAGVDVDFATNSGFIGTLVRAFSGILVKSFPKTVGAIRKRRMTELRFNDHISWLYCPKCVPAIRVPSIRQYENLRIVIRARTGKCQVRFRKNGPIVSLIIGKTEAWDRSGKWGFDTTPRVSYVQEDAIGRKRNKQRIIFSEDASRFTLQSSVTNM